VQFIPRAKLLVGCNVQQPHGLARFGPVSAFLHGGGDGALTTGQNKAAPARYAPCIAGAAGPLLTNPVA